MPDLTSNLRIKLTDDLSGPAGKAAEALKKFGMSAADVEKAGKLVTLREAQANFRQAATAFQTTQTSVKKLAQEFAATENPTKQMTRALERARKQASEAAGDFKKQSEAFRSARTGLRELGVSLNQVASEEERVQGAVRRATTAMEQQAAKAQSVGARVKRGLSEAAGMMAPFLGYGMLHGTKSAIEAGAHLQSEKVSLRVAGVPAADIARASDRAGQLAAAFPNLSRAEILERYKEARSVLLHPEEAMTELPVIAQANSVLKGMEASGKVGEGSAKGLGFALKGAEVLGVAQDPKRLRAYIDSFVKAKQVMGELITPEQIYDFATNVKSSGATLSDRFLHTTAMSLTGELRGMRAGTGIDAFVKQITGGFQGQQHPAAKEFLSLGLLGKQDFETSKTGAILGLKSGHHVAGYKLAMSDPDKWVAQYLIPAMKQHGITDEQEQLALVKKLFTTGRAADIVSKLISQAPSYMNHALLMREAMGLGADGELSNDPTVGLQSLKTAFSDFAAILTSPVMETAAHAMGWVAKNVASVAVQFDMLAKNHPDLAKGIAGGSIAAGIGGGGALAYFSILRPLMKGFGLKSSAAALDVSAAALLRAAGALGGEGILSSLPGGAKPGGPAPKASIWSKIPTGLKTAGGLALSFATAPEVLGVTAGLGAGLGAEYLNEKQGITRESTRERQRRQAAKYNWWGKYEPQGALGSAPEVTPSMTFGTGIADAGYRVPLPQARPPEGPQIDSRPADAKAAGESFGDAFRSGVSTSIQGAVHDVEDAVKRMLGLMTFSASPNLNPAVPGGTSSPGSGFSGYHGAFSDYGIKP